MRYAAAVVCGLGLTLAFPQWGIAGAAWVAPGLILFCAMGADGRTAFRVGWIAGMAHFLSALCWLLRIPYTFWGIPFWPGVGWLALSAYSALYPALWVWLAWKVCPRSEPGQNTRDGFLSSSWGRRMRWAALCGAMWMGLEVIRGGFLSGFPWIPLGASQYRMIPLIQIASVGGVYAVSFLVVWTSVAVVMALARLVLKDSATPRETVLRLPTVVAGGLSADVFIPLAVVASVVAIGANKIFKEAPPTRELKAALVQPSVPQTLIWDTNADAVRFEKLLKLSREACANKPDLLIWPEAAVPSLSEENVLAISALAKSNHVWILLCADDADPPLKPEERPRYYNASFLLSPDGRLAGRYIKRRLVIFGEYIPLVKWLPFLRWFIPIGDGFTPGPGPVQFVIHQPDAVMSPLICFEDVFPQEVGDHVLADTDFLVNLTNDGWFGDGAAQWQQAACAVFRAVENGVPLVRCTNNGLTCWIDAFGRIRQIGCPENIYGTGFMTATIPLQPTGAAGRTFYNLHGNLFAWAGALWSAASLLAVRLGNRKKKA